MVGRTVNTRQVKAELRQRISALRDALPEDERAERSRLIARRVLLLPGWQRARSRLVFASFRSEVRTELLMQDTLKRRARLVLPRVVAVEQPLALHEVHDPQRDLAPGWCGIPEPMPERCPEVSVFDVDFIVVPGLVFDRSGGRLGWGAGFFDWVLGNRPDLIHSNAVAAVAFDLQLVEQVPMEPWDVRVPLIVTETELIRVPLEK